MAGSGGGTEQLNRVRHIAVVYAIGGVTYPFWSLVGQGAVDPPQVWWAIGVLLLLGAAQAARWPLRPHSQARVSAAFCWIVSFHFFCLAALNGMSPFYSVGSTMAVLASVMTFRSLGAMKAFGAFIGSVAVLLYALDPHVLKLAYWLSPLPTAVFAYQRLRAQLALEHRLEDEVAERTLQLTEANQRLRGEIDARTRLEDQLRSRHKAEAVGRLAGGVAHDFNNILTTIGVYAELLDERLPPESALREEVDRIRHAQHQASDLTQQLLTLGSRSHVPTERIDLVEALRDQTSLLRHMLGEHELEVRLRGAPLSIFANPDQLQQIAINLALNARDAMTEPGRLTIETARCDAATLTDRLGADVENGPYALLAASDTGSGMTAETRERAFDPFFSTKGPGRGTGLGLSTLHGIVSQAGGHVRLESEPGRGARFELYWPLAEHCREPVTATRLPASGNGTHANILLVEDEEAVRVALERVLTNAGHAVTAAVNGEQALAWMAEPGTRCDLVISDVVMPQMNGLELARSLAKTHPEVRVILISGHLHDRAMHEWDESYSFLSKPFAPSDLMQKVREVLAPLAAPA